MRPERILLLLGLSELAKVVVRFLCLIFGRGREGYFLNFLRSSLFLRFFGVLLLRPLTRLLLGLCLPSFFRWSEVIGRIFLFQKSSECFDRCFLVREGLFLRWRLRLCGEGLCSLCISCLGDFWLWQAVFRLFVL